MDEVLVKLLLAMMFAAGASFVALVGYFVWDELTTDKFYLRKDSWVCTGSRTELTYSLMPIGKSVQPIATSHQVCDQWTRTK